MVREEEASGDCVRVGEGISQKTYEDSWMWTTVRELTTEVRNRLDGGG